MLAIGLCSIAVVACADVADVPVEPGAQAVVVPPQSPNGEESPDYIASEQLLVALYKHFHTLGLLPGPPPANRAAVWSLSNLDAFADVIDAHYAERGGYLTQTQVSAAGAVATVVPVGAQISVQFPGGGAVTAPRRGISSSCSVVEVTPSEPHPAGKVVDNARCLYAQALAAAVVPVLGGAMIDDAFIEASGAVGAVEAYLADASSDGLVDSFDIDPTGLVTVVEGAERAGFFLDPGSANPYASASIEAAEVGKQVNGWVAGGALVFTSATLPPEAPLLVLERARVTTALRAAHAEPQGVRRATYLGEIFGVVLGPVEDEDEPAPSGGGELGPRSLGTTTPRNRLYVHLEGFDSNGALELDPLEPLIGTMFRVGYKQTHFDFRRAVAPNASRLTRLLEELARSATLFIEAHGLQAADDSYPGTFQVLRWASGDRNLLCAELKKAFVEAGYVVPGDLCSGTIAHNTTIDVLGFPATFQAIGAGWVLNVFAPIDRVSHLTTAAASLVITTQCGGGGDLNAHMGDVGDYWHPVQHKIAYSTTEQCDLRLLDQDLRAASVRKVDCVATAPTHPSEPFCLLADAPEALLGFEMRTVQGSQRVRGRVPGPPGFVIQDSSGAPLCPKPTGPNGWQRYLGMLESGDPSVEIELAPTATELTRHVLPPEPAVDLGTTSKLVSAFVNVEPHQCPPRIAGGLQAEDLTQVHGDHLTRYFSQHYSLMSESEWATEPSALRYRYQRDQGDWPWYLRVEVVAARGANTVPFLGNKGGPRPAWLWRDGHLNEAVPPASLHRGLVSDYTKPDNKNRTFTVDIPCMPPRAACMPVIELDYPDDGGLPAAHPNGCECDDGVAAGGAFVAYCCTMYLDGTNDGCHYFRGMTREECESQSNPALGYVMHYLGRWEGVHFMWDECCVPGEPGCEDVLRTTNPPPPGCEPGTEYESGTATYQHVEWPIDLHGAQQCDTVHFEGVCTGG